MEKIQPGKYVELYYDLYEITPDGDKLVHHMTADDAERIVFGVTQGVIEPLEKALDGLQQGDSFEAVVKPDEAYGQYDPEKLVTLPRDIFVVEGKFDDEVVRPGAVLPMMTADGMRISGLVKEVTDTDVKMDFNHPLAGKDVKFKGTVKVVRDATPEELQPVEGGCGCGCSSCGDDCSCDSSENCGDKSCGCK